MVQHILEATDVSPENLLRIFKSPKQVGKRFTKDLEGVMVALIFFEDSANTETAFEAAIKFAGGEVIKPNPQRLLAQGEDYIRDFIYSLYGKCHCIVLRHPSATLMKEIAQHSRVPIINAGDGEHEHPIQAFTDLYTIWQARQDHGREPLRIPKEREKLNVLCWGNNRTHRAVRSTVKLLATHGPTLGLELERIGFYGPTPYHEPQDDVLKALGTTPIDIYPSRLPSLKEVDIVYVTRAFDSTGNSVFVEPFTNEFAKELPEHAIIMGHLPRNGVLPFELDTNQRAWYFKQSANALPICGGFVRHLFNNGKLQE